MVMGAGKKGGTGFVPIKPDAEGFGNQLEGDLKRQGGPAASRAGQHISTAMKGAFLGGVALMGKSVLDFADFDKGMREVFTLMPTITAPAMDEMTQQVKDFSSEFGVLPTETIPALYSSISAGVPADNVFSFLETAQKLAKGGVTELETAVDGLSSVVNAYGSDVITAEQASDLMFTAVKGGKTTVDELAASLFQVIPTAAASGVEFSNVTAALATMTAAGTPTSVATTQLRQMFVELNKDGSKTSALFEELSGKSFSDFIAEGGNVQNALEILGDHAHESNLSIADLFGSVEAGNAALSLTGANAEKFFNELQAGESAAGATEEAFNTMNEGLSATMDRLKARFSVTLINLGTELAPVIEDLGTMLADVLDIFASLPAPMQTFIIVGATGLAGLIAFSGPLLRTIKLFGMMGKAMTLLAANPWMLAAVVLAGIAYLVITNWEEVEAFFIAFGETIADVWDATYEATVGFVTGIYDAVVGTFDSIGQFFIDYWPFLLGIFTGGVGLIVGLIIQNWDAIWGKTSEVASAIASFFTTAWDTVYSTTTSVGGAVVGFITGIPGTIAGAFTTLAQTISAPFVAAFSGIKSAWNSTVGGFGFDVPGWIPGVGGKGFNIPSMATGGVLADPTLFLGGEYPGARRDPEIVTPQSIMRETVLAALGEVNATRPVAPSVVIKMNVSSEVRDPNFFERQAVEIARVVRRELERTEWAGGAVTLSTVGGG